MASLKIQSTHPTAPNLCKDVSPIFGCNVLRTASTQRRARAYPYSTQYGKDRAKAIKKTGTAVNAACQANISACQWSEPRLRYPACTAHVSHYHVACLALPHFHTSHNQKKKVLLFPTTSIWNITL